MGRSVPWAVLCLGSFNAVFRSVPWVDLCRGLFCAVGRFKLGPFRTWVVLSLGVVSSLGCFVMSRFELGPFRDGPFCMCT